MGFKKAVGQQAALKIGIFGPAGVGKTVLALLISEGLAELDKKRIAFVDTERGTDFYSKPVAARAWHPEAFDFDALYSRSITEVLAEIKKLNPKDHSVVVIDSITHIWEACIAAYRGNQTSAGTIPMQAWSRIKKPYKELMALLLSSSMHVIFCGRQGNEYGETESGELKNIGYKMKAEGETAYEPHMLLRLETSRPTGKGKNLRGIPTAYVEKDRSGILAGQVIDWPNFEKIAQPILGLLSGKQAHIPDEEETGKFDAEAMARQEREKEAHSRITRERYEARFQLATNRAEVEVIIGEITPDLTKSMLAPDVATLRKAASAAREKHPVAAVAAPSAQQATKPTNGHGKRPPTPGKHRLASLFTALDFTEEEATEAIRKAGAATGKGEDLTVEQMTAIEGELARMVDERNAVEA